MLGNAIYTNYWNVFQLFSFPDIAITSVHVPTFEMIVIPSMRLSLINGLYLCSAQQYPRPVPWAKQLPHWKRTW